MTEDRTPWRPTAAAPAPDALVALGWDDRVAAACAGIDASWRLGRVIRNTRRFTYVGTESGLVPAMAEVGLEPPPVAGDWVAIDVGDQEGSEIVRAVAPRWSELRRRDPSGTSGEQVLAANVDVVLIVLGLDRPVKVGRVERSLVVGFESGATPVVVLTKSDAVAPEDLAAVLADLAPSVGDVEVHVLSSTTGEGVEAVRRHLEGNHTLVLLGESGAGKSTLANRLAGIELQRTAEVREGDAKGRHTTVTRDLIVLPAGGVLIDTPGIRGLGLVDADEGLAAAFGDIEALAESCRFRDCTHQAEPGCAVRAAVQAGTLPAERLDRYLLLGAELDAAADAKVDAERRRSDKSADKSMKAGYRSRDGDDDERRGRRNR